eukprot:270443-Rhodomonas_salina.1
MTACSVRGGCRSSRRASWTSARPRVSLSRGDEGACEQGALSCIFGPARQRNTPNQLHLPVSVDLDRRCMPLRRARCRHKDQRRVGSVLCDGSAQAGGSGAVQQVVRLRVDAVRGAARTACLAPPGEANCDSPPPPSLCPAPACLPAPRAPRRIAVG